VQEGHGSAWHVFTACDADQPQLQSSIAHSQERCRCENTKNIAKSLWIERKSSFSKIATQHNLHAIEEQNSQPISSGRTPPNRQREHMVYAVFAEIHPPHPPTTLPRTHTHTTTMDNYVKYHEIGTGTYGAVYEAMDKRSGERVALKKIRTQNTSDGVHFSVLREVKLLQELQHRHVVSLRDVFIHHENIFMAVEFLVTDLEVVIRDPRIILTEAHIKTYMSALLDGVAYCHRNWVLHRDLKPNNLLIGADGEYS
jgi:Protein kinase domain